MNVQEFLPYIAGALQWARAQKKFSEVLYILIVAAASGLFYALGHPTDAFAHPWNEVLNNWWEQAKTILAMTQVVSSGSNIINGMRGSAGPVPVALPVTNSQ